MTIAFRIGCRVHQTLILCGDELFPRWTLEPNEKQPQVENAPVGDSRSLIKAGASRVEKSYHVGVGSSSWQMKSICNLNFEDDNFINKQRKSINKTRKGYMKALSFIYGRTCD